MSRTDEPFLHAVYLTASAGSGDALQDFMLGTVGAALATPGNRGFSILRSTETPTNFLVVERWDNEQALPGNRHSSVLAEALAQMADQRLVASGPSGSRWTRII